MGGLRTPASDTDFPVHSALFGYGMEALLGIQAWLEKLFPIVQCITLIGVGIFLFFNYKCGKDPQKRKPNREQLNKYMQWGQWILPISFLMLGNYEYIREGQVIRLYQK